MKITWNRINTLTAGTVRVLAFSVLLAAAAAAQTTTFNVNSTADEPDIYPGDGFCFSSSGLCTLRAAVQEASEGPSSGSYNIVLQARQYALTIHGSTGDLVVRGNVNISGVKGGGTVVYADPGNPITFGDSIFQIPAGSRVTLNGLRIEGGLRSIVNSGDLTVKDCIITSWWWDGIQNKGVLRVDSSTFTESEGNITIRNQGTLEIANSTIEKIIGALLSFEAGSSALIRNSTINGNTDNETLSVAGSLTMMNSTISGNRGGHVTGSGIIKLVSCTFHDNTDSSTGAFFVFSGTVYMRATILDEGNYACDSSAGGRLISEGYNIDAGSNLLLQSHAEGDLSGRNPMVNPTLAYNGGLTRTHALYWGSPAIDAISSAVAKSSPLIPENRVAIVKADSGTQGNWKGVYGTDGFNVIYDTTRYRSYVTVTPISYNGYIWANSTSDPRGLLKATSSTDRIAACWYSSSSLEIDLSFNDTFTHQVALHLLDWDKYNAGRIERVDVVDLANNVLNTRSVSNFGGGLYLVWNLGGHVKLRITNTGAASNAVVSGLFLDRDPASLSFVPGVDQRGIARPAYPNSGTGYIQSWRPVYDIGAVEYVLPTILLF